MPDVLFNFASICVRNFCFKHSLFIINYNWCQRNSHNRVLIK